MQRKNENETYTGPFPIPEDDYRPFKALCAEQGVPIRWVLLSLINFATETRNPGIFRVARDLMLDGKAKKK